jgi:Cytochrome c7 and related cytochrome c/NapC/NirT cytochrome c family, N-terminal region
MLALAGAYACSSAFGQAGATATGKPAPKDNCSTCHQALASGLSDPVRLLRGSDVHAAAGLGCTSCHGGDPAATNGRIAHAGAEFVARLERGDAMAAMCGRCHKKPAENYLNGPHHLATAARKPDCSTCHGVHGIKPASIALIGEPLCSSCHTLPQARRIYKALDDAEREVSSLDAQLAAGGNNVAERTRLKESRSQLRGLSHALDLFTITRNAAQTLALADEVRAKALPHVASKHWGRRLRIAGIVLAALMIAVAGAWGVRVFRAKKLSLPRPRGTELLLVSGVLGVLAVAAIVGAWKANRYIEHDPKFCTSCHTMNSAYSLWDKSGHRNVECHTCHAPNLVSNLHQLWVYATRRPDEVIKHAEVDRSICEKCHTGGGQASKWNQVLETPGHRVHVGKQRIECVQCHATSVHRFVPPKETCSTCHKKVTLAAAGTMAEMHCQECHPFMAQDAKRPLKPDRSACLDCHEIRQIKGETFPAKAPMKWDCGKCHKPHERMYIADADCKKCHDTANEGIHRVKGHTACLDCHKPHGWTTVATTCTGCHTKISPDTHWAKSGQKCKDCHGAWDDEFVPKPLLTAKKPKKSASPN